MGGGSGSRLPGVAVVEATDSRERDDLGVGLRRPLDPAAGRRVLAERQMRPILEVVGDVGRQQPVKMTLVEHDHVI